MIVFLTRLVEVPFCAGAFCTAKLTVPSYVGVLDFPAFTCVACSKHFPLLAFRVEMAFQGFPALVVVFI